MRSYTVMITISKSVDKLIFSGDWTGCTDENPKSRFIEVEIIMTVTTYLPLSIMAGNKGVEDIDRTITKVELVH